MVNIFVVSHLTCQTRCMKVFKKLLGGYIALLKRPLGNWPEPSLRGADPSALYAKPLVFTEAFGPSPLPGQQTAF